MFRNTFSLLFAKYRLSEQYIKNSLTMRILRNRETGYYISLPKIATNNHSYSIIFEGCCYIPLPGSMKEDRTIPPMPLTIPGLRLPPISPIENFSPIGNGYRVSVITLRWLSIPSNSSNKPYISIQTINVYQVYIILP